MIALAILMTLVAAWCFIDIFAASSQARKKQMSSDFVAVYGRLFIISTLVAIVLWVQL